MQAPLLWIGTDDGYIHVTQDDGKTWTNVTPRELTPWSKVVMIEASHFDANEAYAAVDRHRLDGQRAVHLSHAATAARRGRRSRSGLPAGVYMQTVKEDPKRRGLLVAGTELGVFVSFNDGDDWQSLQLNLPPVVDARPRVPRQRSDRRHARPRLLGARRHQRAAAGDADVAAADAHLFKPADAIILPPGTDDGTPTQKDEPEAENPPTGAVIDYYLKSGGERAGDDRDPRRGRRRRSAATRAPIRCRRSIRTRSPSTRSGSAPQDPPSAAAGMHRFVWDLRPTPPPAAAAAAAAVAVVAAAVAAARRRSRPAAYSVKLTVNGRAYTQPLTVKPDPR